MIPSPRSRPFFKDVSMTFRIAIAAALCCALSACIIAPPHHGGGWHDPHWHGGPDHGGYGRR